MTNHEDGQGPHPSDPQVQGQGQTDGSAPTQTQGMTAQRSGQTQADAPGQAVQADAGQLPAATGQQLPAEVMETFESDAGAGQEGMTGLDDYAIPRLNILQDNSPQCKKSEAEFMPDAEAGMFYDTVLKHIYSGETGIDVVPVSYRRAYIEWKLREKGGGIVKDHGLDGSIMDTTEKDDKNRDITPAGTQVVITAEYFAFLVDTHTGDHRPVVISMKSTQLKKARQWNFVMNQWKMPAKNGGTFNPAMFARCYRFTTLPERNESGSWFGFNIVPGKVLNEIPNGMAIYTAAKEFRSQVQAGKVKVSVDTDQNAMGDAIPESDDSPM